MEVEVKSSAEPKQQTPIQEQVRSARVKVKRVKARLLFSLHS